jgi:hypothetical protein
MRLQQPRHPLAIGIPVSNITRLDYFQHAFVVRYPKETAVFDPAAQT